MASSNSGRLKEHLLSLLIGGVFFAGWAYSITSSYQSAKGLEHQSEKLGEIQADLQNLKKSVISMLLDKTPNKPEIIKGLVRNSYTLKGIDSFNAGNFDAAYALWLPAAQKGNNESVLAIMAANETLKGQVQDASLPPEYRAKVQAALLNAPNVEVRDGVFVIKPKH